MTPEGLTALPQSSIRRSSCRGRAPAPRVPSSPAKSTSVVPEVRWDSMQSQRACSCALSSCALGSRRSASRRGQRVPRAPSFVFTRTVYSIFEAAQCRGCHADDGVASATRLHFPDPNASPDEIEAFGITLAVLVDRTDPASIAADQQADQPRASHRRRSHPARVIRGSRRSREWVRHLAGASRRGGRRGARAASRGTRDRRHRDQLLPAADAQPVQQHGSRSARRLQPAGGSVSARGFRQRLQEPAAHAGHAAAAGRGLQRRGARSWRSTRSAPATSTGWCRANLRRLATRSAAISSFGHSACRAFRRPLTDAELRRYARARSSAQAAKTGQFLDGARVVVEAMLQSPKFLFHVEAGADRPVPRLRDRQPALVLPLGHDAGPRSVRGGGQRRAAIRRRSRARSRRRMLDQPPARQAVDEFFAQWLRFDRALGSVKDRRRYPEFTPELAAMMVQETRMLLGQPRVERRQFHGGVHRRLQLPECRISRASTACRRPPGEFERVRFPAGSHRVRPARPRIVSGVERRTGRNVADRARHFHPRAAALPARAESAARREHAGAGADDRAAAAAAAAHAGARRESDVRELPPPRWIRSASAWKTTTRSARWRDQEAIEFEIRSAGHGRRARRWSCRLTATGEIAGLANSRVLRAANRSDACSPTAAPARNASSNRCSATRSAVSETPADRESHQDARCRVSRVGIQVQGTADRAGRGRRSSSRSLETAMHGSQPCPQQETAMPLSRRRFLRNMSMTGAADSRRAAAARGHVQS